MSEPVPFYANHSCYECMANVPDSRQKLLSFALMLEEYANLKQGDPEQDAKEFAEKNIHRLYS